MDINQFIKEYHTHINDKPIFININSESDFQKLNKFLSENRISFYSPINDQLKEYKEVFQLFHQGRVEKFKQVIAAELGNSDTFCGEFVYFNWGEKAVFNILPQSMFYELITWRNKDKLNFREQETISSKKIGIIGSSVGSFATKVLAKSGFQYLKLAELKDMKPSNGPRMYMDSMRNYGVHKLKPLIQNIYEFNPYCQIDQYYEGLQQSNKDEFFYMNGEKLDLVVDAADDAKTKVLIRKYCKELKIPMITGFDEKGCLIIDRFDKPELMKYRGPELNPAELENLKATNPRAYVMKLLEYIPEGGYNNLTDRQKETVEGIFNGTRGGFSQLAWEASLFSAYISKAVIDVLLGQDISGYRFFDLDMMISEGMQISRAKKAS